MMTSLKRSPVGFIWNIPAVWFMQCLIYTNIIILRRGSSWWLGNDWVPGHLLFLCRILVI